MRTPSVGAAVIPEDHPDARLSAKAKALGLVIVGIMAMCGSGDATSSSVRGPLPETVESWVIPNYNLVQPDLAIGGQPTAGGLTWLPAIGFRIVIDLRTPSEGTAAEETALKPLGMRYLSVPITPES